MSYAGESSIQARVREVEKEYAARQTKLFTRFALIEGAVLLVAILAVYVLRIVDAEVGLWVLVGIAAAGGLVLSMLLMQLVQGRSRAVAQAKGENPLF